MELTLRDQVRQRLAAYGNTTDEVAETLRTAQVTGRRRSAFCCPIANDLQRELGQPPQTFAVTNRYVAVFPADLTVPPDYVYVPAAVAVLILAVDGLAGLPGGRYADLVEVPTQPKEA